MRVQYHEYWIRSLFQMSGSVLRVFNVRDTNNLNLFCYDSIDWASAYTHTHARTRAHTHTHTHTHTENSVSGTKTPGAAAGSSRLPVHRSGPVYLPAPAQVASSRRHAAAAQSLTNVSVIYFLSVSHHISTSASNKPTLTFTEPRVRTEAAAAEAPQRQGKVPWVAPAASRWPSCLSRCSLLS